MWQQCRFKSRAAIKLHIKHQTGKKMWLWPNMNEEEVWSLVPSVITWHGCRWACVSISKKIMVCDFHTLQSLEFIQNVARNLKPNNDRLFLLIREVRGKWPGNKHGEQIRISAHTTHQTLMWNNGTELHWVLLLSSKYRSMGLEWPPNLGSFFKTGEISPGLLWHSDLWAGGGGVMVLGIFLSTSWDH